MPDLRQKFTAAMLHMYPFYSGSGTIANSSIVRRFAPDSSEEVWACVPGNHSIVAPLDDYVGRAAYYMGDLDRKISWVLSRLVQPGDTALDIGANLGLVTVFLSSLVGESGTVHSFEPNSRLARCIERAIHHNKLTNVDLHNVGLGDMDTELLLSVPIGNSGEATLLSRPECAQFSGVMVPVRRLSALAKEAGISKIDIIKMDVEGFEPNVLRGGWDVLSRCRPRAIIFELHQADVRFQEHPTVKILSDLGYGFLSLPKRFIRMRAERCDPKSARRIVSHDFVAAPLGDTLDEIGARLGAG